MFSKPELGFLWIVFDEGKWLAEYLFLSQARAIVHTWKVMPLNRSNKPDSHVFRVCKPTGRFLSSSSVFNSAWCQSNSHDHPPCLFLLSVVCVLFQLCTFSVALPALNNQMAQICWMQILIPESLWRFTNIKMAIRNWIDFSPHSFWAYQVTM